MHTENLGSHHDNTIQPADPAARRRALLIVIIFAVIGVAAILGINRAFDQLHELAREDPQEAAQQGVRLLRTTAVGAALALLAIAGWFLHTARRIYRAQRFPPPGVAVIRPTRVLSGRAARRRAILAATISGALLLSGVVLLGLLWSISSRLAAG